MSSLGDVRKPRDQQSLIAAVIYLGVLGANVILTIPVFVGGLVRYGGFGDAQAGYVATLEIAGTALAALMAVFWIDRVSWRSLALVAVVLSCLFDLATAVSSQATLIYSLRFMRGFAAGCLVALAYGALAQTERSDRAYGFFSSAQLAYMVCGLVAYPIILNFGGIKWLYGATAIWAVPGLYAVSLLPSGSMSGDAPARSLGTKHHRALVIVMLMAITIGFISQGSIWTFAERIGVNAGILGSEVGVLLAMSSIAGLLGALAATVSAGRVDKRVAFGVMGVLPLASLYSLHGTLAPFTFFLCIATLKFAWNFTIPYQLGHLSDLDRSGKSAVLCSCLTPLGLSVGSGVASVAITRMGYSGPPLIAAITWPLMIALVLISLTRFGGSLRA